MPTLVDGQTYRNKRGDLRGPMRFIPQTHGQSWFVDQYGTQFYPDGTEVNHTPKSTANIDLKSAADLGKETRQGEG